MILPNDKSSIWHVLNVKLKKSRTFQAKYFHNTEESIMAAMINKSVVMAISRACATQETAPLTAVKRRSMCNALIPGHQPWKFPAQKFNWNHCRNRCHTKKSWMTVINLLKWSDVLQREGFRFHSWYSSIIFLYSPSSLNFLTFMKKVLRGKSLSPPRFVYCRCHWAWPPEADV